MIQLLASQKQSDRAFRKWVSAMLDASKETADGWVIEGRGVAFNNYGHGKPHEINEQVMLGIDPDSNNGIVKIVKPDVHQADRGKLTSIGFSEDGKLLLLRQGRLQKNKLSRSIVGDFGDLTDLHDIPVRSGFKKSTRQYYVVADLSSSYDNIVNQTADFTLACARARMKAGGGSDQVIEPPQQQFGLDEKGRISLVKFPGGVKEVCALQGYVYERLKKIIGDDLVKPKNTYYTVDGYIKSKSILIEIKTSVSAHNIYEAVGQIFMYPQLTNLPPLVARIILLPDSPPINPLLAASIKQLGIEIYTYRVGAVGRKPQIEISKAMLSRCGA